MTGVDVVYVREHVVEEVEEAYSYHGYAAYDKPGGDPADKKVHEPGCAYADDDVSAPGEGNGDGDSDRCAECAECQAGELDG